MSAAGGLLGGRRVLIVEDRYLIASELELDVRRMGGAVAGPVRSVEAARKILAAERVDLGLLDVNLEGESVFPIAQALAELGTPFIFVTGYDDWEWPAEWSGRPRLSKPVSNRALRAQVERLIGNLSLGPSV